MVRLCFAAVLLAAVPVAAQDKPDPVGAALIACAPSTYEAAVTCLDQHLPAESKATLREPQGSSLAHFGLGMFLRNNWSLWGGGPLAQWMRARGVQHPDSMSGVILEGFAARLRGEPSTFEAISSPPGAAAVAEPSVNPHSEPAHAH